MSDYVAKYLAQGGTIKQLPYGNAVRPNDGETWKQINARKWAVKLDKERAQ